MNANKFTPPTERQVAFADEIAYVLGIDFPICSMDYTKWSYYKFISNNLYKFQEICNSDPAFEDEMSWWDPHAESGY